MNTKILSAFREFMGSQNYSPSTIRQYIKSLDGLPNPTGYEPLILLRYIDDYLSANQPVLTKYTYKNVRAALNALFFMCCGISIRAFRKSHSVTDQYSSVLNSYKDYCISFLHLTEPVTLAAIREVHKFLVAMVPDISCVDWSSITANTITEYISQNLSQLSPSSIGVSVTAIRRLFRFLYFCDVKIHQSILTLPLATPVWSKNGCLPTVLSDEEISRITKHYFASDSIGLRDKAVLYCFLELGLRCSEVAKLELADFNWHNATVTIQKTKSHTKRILPISSKLGKVLENYILKGRPYNLNGSLFFKSKQYPTKPATVETIRNIIRRIFKCENISGWHVGTHALRRTVGSRLYNTGVDLKTVSDILGHASVNTTNAYIKVNIEGLRSVAAHWPRRDSYEMQ